MSEPRSGGGKGEIELREVTKRYGGERVVDAVSAKIRPGEFFSLLGPSGSGKTTSLLMIAGFATVDEGRILLDGADIADVPPQKRGFGMVFQNYAIFPHLSVFENVAFPLRARSTPEAQVRERVAAALELVRLSRFADRNPRQLSGGQQQRVAIARAIVFNPSVVLMDEPLGALDKNLRFQMQVEIKDIQRRLGMTVVYVTHDQEEAMNMSDRIAIMNNGRIVQVGPPTEIYEHPHDVFVARFLGEANLLEARVESVSEQSTMVRTAGGLALRARAPQGITDAAQGHVFFRPERVTIEADEGSISSMDSSVAGDSNRAQGRIAQASFLGNILRYAVDIEPGQQVTVDVQNARGVRPLATGTNVRLSWHVADSVLLLE
ncbi:MAG: ABC transporter ATP-binding protein [Burkholderiaceae bacterium]